MSHKELIKAVAYFRTSSMTNVGDAKDTLKRQREAVAAFAKAAGYDVIAEYSDDGVKGADQVDQRPGFAAMLQHIAGNGVRTVIVETANRFARDLIVQETGWRFLQGLGVTLIAADSPDASTTHRPQFLFGKSSARWRNSRRRPWSPSSVAPVSGSGVRPASVKDARASPSRRLRLWHWRSGWRAIRLMVASVRCARSPPSSSTPDT
jgi:hypothetical protein